MDFHCEICNAGFYYKRYLSGHKKRIHGIKTAVSTNGQFPCAMCEKRFSTKRALSGHTAKVHNLKRLSFACKEENCQQKFSQLNELRKHLRCQHEIVNIDECEKKEFVTYEEFSDWLAMEEVQTDAKYVISSKKNGDGCKYITFSCHRSGIYKPATDADVRQRQFYKGTRKLGFHCTSSIQVKEYDNKVLVSYYKGHYKHSNELSHAPNSTMENEIYAGRKGIEKKRLLKLKRKASVVVTKLNSLSNLDDVSIQIERHLIAIERLLLVAERNNVKCQSSNLKPTNKNNFKQRVFSSVNTEHSNKKIKLSKPSSEDIIVKEEALLNEEM